MKAVNILWDTDGVKVELPKEVEIPEGIAGDVDEISDFLSDQTGFCHNGFELKE